MLLVGFIIRIYHNARSLERQIRELLAVTGRSTIFQLTQHQTVHLVPRKVKLTTIKRN